ncbi:hypothetical protein [Bradyrhizobium sp. 62]|uniref:hypothetical protein n=1 Tax=Bradyrhizobium sp. 62 TaxID=1043588 RepID=UPI001FF707CA|nr:hypothetical protein [Bradyrhizobium sp. 62]MCK1367613.1 hypothetical protein [Bradyrhizobium sp. 62]
MTIASQTSRISYNGDGSTTAFSVPFYFAANADLVVYLRDAGGNSTLQVLGTNYNLTGATLSAGGTCTFITAPANTYSVVIYRDPALTQTTSYNNNDPFPAKSHELALDKALTIDQRTRDLVTRSMHLSDGDDIADMAIPTIEIRKGKVAGYSPADGTPIVSDNTIATLDTVLSGALATSGGFNRIVLTATITTLKAMTPFAGAVVFMQGYAVNNDGGEGVFIWNASSTATPNTGIVVQPDAGGIGRWVRSFDGPILPQWFGAKGDGTTDDTTAFQSTITASAGGVLDGDGLSYKITTTLTGISDIEIRNCKMVQSTNAAHPIINFADKTNWQIRRVWFAGDGSTTLDYSSSKNGALQFTNTTSTAFNRIAIEDCYLTNFADNYIIIGQMTGSGGIDGFRCSNIKLDSTLGTYTDQTRVGINLFGSATGKWRDSIVENCVIDGNALTIGIAFWSGNDRFICRNNLIKNVGANSAFNAAVGSQNCYGILAYDNVGSGTTSAAKNGTIQSNIIVSPPSAGIYTAGAANIDILDNLITGQFRTDETSIRRAGISLTNPLEGSRVSRNRLINCWGGIALTGPSDTVLVEATENQIEGSSASDSFGVVLTASVSTTLNSRIVVRDNDIKLSGSASIGIRQITSGASYLGTVTVKNNVFSSPYACIDFGAMTTVGTVTIKGNKYSGANSSAAVLANGITSALVVQGETFDLQGNTGYGINIGSSTNVGFYDSVFLNKSAGLACVTAIGATGGMEGIKFRFCSGTLRVVVGSMGYTAPVFNGITGDVVQDISSGAYTEAGVTPKYTILGWVCVTGATWLPRRLPTGG